VIPGVLDPMNQSGNDGVAWLRYWASCEAPENEECREPVDRIDRHIGRLVMRFWAVLAFLGAAAAAAFGAIVLANGHLPGLLALLLAVLLLWLGLRAWRDDATLGEVLSRDFEGTPDRANLDDQGEY
jgi:hypothetical protein